MTSLTPNNDTESHPDMTPEDLRSLRGNRLTRYQTAAEVRAWIYARQAELAAVLETKAQKLRMLIIDFTSDEAICYIASHDPAASFDFLTSVKNCPAKVRVEDCCLQGYKPFRMADMEQVMELLKIITAVFLTAQKRADEKTNSE